MTYVALYDILSQNAKYTLPTNVSIIYLVKRLVALRFAIKYIIDSQKSANYLNTCKVGSRVYFNIVSIYAQLD